MAAERRIFLLCDCDGTLVPICSHPQDTAVGPDLLVLLAGLVRQPHLRVGIVSGRPALDLRRLFPVPGLYLAALHGALLLSPDGREEWLVQKPPPEAWRLMLDMARQSAVETPGIIVEEKEAGLAFHYRQARNGEQYARAFRKLVQPLLDPAGMEILAGKKVLEIRPQGAHKGLAVRRLLQTWPGALPVYLGDDLTDEDAFREVRSLGGVGILVGPQRPSQAAERLDNPEEVWRFLAETARGLSRPAGVSLVRVPPANR